MKYRVRDLGRSLCGSLDPYVLRALTGEPDPHEIEGGVLRWARAVEFLRQYVGDMGALVLAIRLQPRHTCPNLLSVVNRRVVQIDGAVYSMDTAQEVAHDRHDLLTILESHALNLGATEALVERDLRRALPASDAGAALGRSAPSPPGSPASA